MGGGGVPYIYIYVIIYFGTAGVPYPMASWTLSPKPYNHPMDPLSRCWDGRPAAFPRRLAGSRFLECFLISFVGGFPKLGAFSGGPCKKQ